MNKNNSSSAVTYSGVVSTTNADRSPLLSAIVSVLVRGFRLTIDLPRRSATAKNLMRTGECVINLPDAETTVAIERLAHAVTSINSDVDFNLSQAAVGGGFARVHMTLVPSEAVSALRALECPIQIEAKVESNVRVTAHERFEPIDESQTFELHILRVHIDPPVVDRDVRWRPFMTCLRDAYRASS